MCVVQVHVPQIQYIDEVVDVPVTKHRLGSIKWAASSLIRQVPVPVKQQKHIEAGNSSE